MAPALPQAVAAVFVRLLPLAVTPTRLVQTTASAPAGAASSRSEITTELSVAFWL